MLRPRRLRRTAALRRLVAETRLGIDDLVAPLFVADGLDDPRPIGSLPGVSQHSLNSLVEETQRLVDLGVPGVILFGLPKPEDKDSSGSAAWHPDGITQRALRAVRDAVGDEVVVMADCCLDEFTDHGHCGVIDARTGRVDNDATIDLYARLAVAQAEAGAAVIAPSGMMDGQVAAIRHALDAGGFSDTAILAYAAKYASALYGPFREAADSAPSFGDRASYQHDFANARHAQRELLDDIDEGADILMVKPGIAYLDIVLRARELSDLPIAAYAVSGEYSMIKAAAERGWLDEKKIVLETLTAFRRAGADLVITYHAKEAAKWLSNN